MTSAVASLATGRRTWFRAQRDGVSLVLLGFAAALAIFLLVPPFLTDEIGVAAGFTGQEALDLVTPVVAMTLFVLALELSGRSSTGLRVLAVAIVAVWVAGQGIHLAANAIGDVYRDGPAREAFYATPAGSIDHWLDEVLSHWLWHAGWVGLLVILLWVAAAGRAAAASPTASATALAGLAGMIHGFTWFVVTDEGRTWPLAIVASAIVLGAALLLRSRDSSGRVITTFLAIGSAATLALYAVWVLVAGWEPKSLIDTLKLL